jgi:hypothetical protein
LVGIVPPPSKTPLALLVLALATAIATAGCGTSAAPAGSKADASDTHNDGSVGVTDGAYPITCNGHAELCGRPYNQVVFPGTHGSYADTTEGFTAPDQTYPIAQQLEAGIRVLHFELHIYEGAVAACHSLCALGARPFADETTAVASFLRAHPSEVVTLLLERSDDTITADDIADVMKAAGLEPTMHAQAVGKPWPTLGAMIQKGERLVALLDNPMGSSVTWLLPRWDLTWETPWDNMTPADFGQCDADRGKMGDGVYVVDTYLENQAIETASESALVNYDPFLIDRLLYCQRATSTLPNFAMVNFYDVSDIFFVVDVLNGFAPAPCTDLGAFPPTAWPPDGGVVNSDGGAGTHDGSMACDATSDAAGG